MKELPKELTIELLNLVLDKKFLNKIVHNSKLSISNNELNLGKDVLHSQINLNIDTLTRIMKEWCEHISFYSIIQADTKIYLDSESSLHSEGGFYYDISFKANTEFEAILKATYWIAKEKGLI